MDSLQKTLVWLQEVAPDVAAGLVQELNKKSLLVSDASDSESVLPEGNAENAHIHHDDFQQARSSTEAPQDRLSSVTSMEEVLSQVKESNLYMEKCLKAAFDRPSSVTVKIDAEDVKSAISVDEKPKVTYTPQNTMLVKRDVSFPNMTIAVDKSLSHGAQLCQRLVELSRMLKKVRKFMDSTHYFPAVDGGDGNPNLGTHVIDDADELFLQYAECEDPLEQYKATPLVIRQPVLRQMSEIYLLQLVPQFQNKIDQDILDILPERVWDQCSPYQEIVGYIYCLRRRYDIVNPDDAEDIIQHLSKGPFHNQNRKTSQVIEKWWSTILTINQMRPDTADFKVPSHAIAKGLRQVILFLNANSGTPLELKHSLSDLAVKSRLNSWRVSMESLENVYTVLVGILGQVKIDNSSNTVCNNYLKGRCSNRNCRFLHTGPNQQVPRLPKDDGRGKGKPSYGQGFGSDGKGGTKAGAESTPYNASKDCRDWWKHGSCYRKGCVFEHNVSKKGRAGVCKDFLAGKCTAGTSCWYKHPQAAAGSTAATHGSKPSKGKPGKGGKQAREAQIQDGELDTMISEHHAWLSTSSKDREGEANKGGEDSPQHDQESPSWDFP